MHFDKKFGETLFIHKMHFGKKFGKLKRRFRSFAESTSMHGFVELYNAKQFFWIIFWLALVVFSFGITAYQVIRATKQFVEQRPATATEFLDPKEYALPPIKACYVHWIYWLDWKKAFSLNFTRNSVLYGMSFLTDVYSSEKFDAKTAEKEFLEKMNFNKFTRLTEFYIAVAKPFPLVETCCGLLVESSSPESVLYFEEIEISYKATKTLLCYSTPGERVVRAARDYQSAMEMDNSWNGYLFNFSVQDQRYKLISDYFTREEYAHYVVIWLKFNSNYWIMPNHLNKDYDKFGLPLYIFPNGYGEDFFEIDYENQEYRINVDVAVRRWGRTKRGNCVPGQKVLAADTRCYANCRAKYFAKVCDCPRVSQSAVVAEDFPSKMCTKKIFFLDYPRNGSNFEAIDSNGNAMFYEKPPKQCPENRFYRDDYDRCQASCLITGCDEWTFTATASVFAVDRSARKYLFKNQTDINVQYPQPLNVEIVVEMDSQSWEDFVGNVGGLLGVWTGASIISFFQLFYLCCFSEDEDDVAEDNDKVGKGQIGLVKY